MMRLQYMSDLHLEFGPLDIPVEGDILVLAGDITVKGWHFEEIRQLGDKFEKVLYIFGNHEGYGSDLTHVARQACEIFEGSNVLLSLDPLLGDLRSFSIDDGPTIHLATLWTDFNRNDSYAMYEAGRWMNDFRVVRVNGERFTPRDAYNIHQSTMAYLREVVEEGDIVVTHHAPSEKSVDASAYAGDILNHAYFSNLEDFILEKKPAVWIHGHMHHTNDYYIGDTHILSNPRGYYQRGDRENAEFDVTKTLEI